MMKTVFALKKEEERNGCKKLHILEFHDLYSSSSFVKMIETRIGGLVMWQGWVKCGQKA